VTCRPAPLAWEGMLAAPLAWEGVLPALDMCARRAGTNPPAMCAPRICSFVPNLGCFPGRAMVSTPSGPVPVAALKVRAGLVGMGVGAERNSCAGHCVPMRQSGHAHELSDASQKPQLDSAG